MRTFYWYLTAYARKHGLLVIASLAIGLAFFWFFVPTISNNLEIRKRHYIGIIGEYTLNSLPEIIKQQLSVGLTQIEEDGSAAPALAERWTVEQDGATYRFLLKKDLTWQDGQPLSPDDVSYDLPDVETIITPNDIVFKLPSPFAPFPTTVAEPVFKKAEKKYLLFFTKPTLIGIGNYRIVDYKRKGTRLTEMIIDGNNERYIYRFFLTEDDAVTAFKRGEVNLIPDLSRKHDIFEWPTAETSELLNKKRYLAVFFNTVDPQLTKSVRLALSYAIDKKTGEERAIGPISPLSWAYLAGGKTYDKDVARGSERLRDELPGEPLKFELTTTTLFEDEAESIKEQLEAFGQQAASDCQQDKAVTEKAKCENLKIAISLRISNFPDTTNFQLLLIGQNIPSDPDQYDLWHSGQSANFTKYKNTRIDNLLEKGRQTYDQKERIAIYQEFQQFFLDDPPAIFLRYLPSYTLKRKSADDASLDFMTPQAR
jgi:peptide/nickel transport system substrate-binding protein